MSRTDCIRVRVVHHDPIAQTGLSAAFARYSDLTVQEANDGFAGNLTPSLEDLRQTDVVVADCMHGMALAFQAARHPDARGLPKVMILAGIDREWEIKSALERGVRGYMLTGCGFDDLAHGVRAVHRGERYLSPQVAARLAESMSIEPLTSREEEVLRLVVDGLCNKAIGKLLGIAVGTVKSHLKSAFDKLGVQSRTQAVAAVERRGLLREQPRTGTQRQSPAGIAHGRMPSHSEPASNRQPEFAG